MANFPCNNDKGGIVLRIETTADDVSTFRHHRQVEHRNGPPTIELAEVRKTIYSLVDPRAIMPGCNHRYLAHLSALDDFSSGVRTLERLTTPRIVACDDPGGGCISLQLIHLLVVFCLSACFNQPRPPTRRRLRSSPVTRLHDPNADPAAGCRRHEAQ